MTKWTSIQHNVLHFRTEMCSWEEVLLKTAPSLTVFPSSVQTPFPRSQCCSQEAHLGLCQAYLLASEGLLTLADTDNRTEGARTLRTGYLSPRASLKGHCRLYNSPPLLVGGPLQSNPWALPHLVPAGLALIIAPSCSWSWDTALPGSVSLNHLHLCNNPCTNSPQITHFEDTVSCCCDASPTQKWVGKDRVQEDTWITWS